MIDTDKYEGHTPAPWTLREEYAYELFVYAGDVRLAKMDGNAPLHTNEHGNPEDVNAQLIADAPLLLAEVKRLRHLCDTLFIYAHNIETGQSTIEKSNGEPLSTIDFEKDMTWVNWVNQPKISNIKIGGISYLKITDDSIHSDGEGDYVLASECKAGHYVGEIGYEDCPDCGGDEE